MQGSLREREEGEDAALHHLLHRGREDDQGGVRRRQKRRLRSVPQRPGKQNYKSVFYPPPPQVTLKPILSLEVMTALMTVP